MARFLIIFLGLYGTLNAYAGWRVAAAARRGWAVNVAWAVWVILMTTGPIWTRMLDRAGWWSLSRGLGTLTYLWMALVFWFLFLMLPLDLWNLGVRAVGLVNPGALAARLPLRIAVGAVGIVLGLTLAWSAFEAHWMAIERVTLTSPRLAPGTAPVRVMQISDVHLGLLEGSRRLGQIERILERERPDLLLSTGDLVDGTAEHLNELAARIARWDAPLGKFAVLGNHEFYVGREHSVRFHESAGFRLLRGETADPSPGVALRLAGVDDPAGGRGPQTRVGRLLPPSGAPRPAMIVMCHQPVIEPGTPGRFDVQLSGHTHSGQIFPFGWLVRLRYEHLRGLARLDGGSALYINRGTGTWGPPLRLFARPEVTILTLVPAPPLG